MGYTCVEDFEHRLQAKVFFNDTYIRNVSLALIPFKTLQKICAQEDCIKIILQEEQKKGYLVALRRLSKQSLHSQKLKRILSNLCVDDSVIQSIIGRCEESGYVDNKEYVSSLASSYVKKGKSRLEFLVSCRRRGFSADGALYDEKSAIQNAYKKLSKSNVEYKKIYMTLRRRGFLDASIRTLKIEPFAKL